MTAGPLGGLSIYELLRLEMEGQAPVLTDALLALEADSLPADQLQICMRCVHSLKGAMRMVDLSAGVNLAHAMEECLVAAQQGQIQLRRPQIDGLLLGVDLLQRITHTPDADITQWTDGESTAAVSMLDALRKAIESGDAPAPVTLAAPAETMAQPQPVDGMRREDRTLRMSAGSLNRLLGLAGESLIASRWPKPFAEALLQLKRLQIDTVRGLEDLDELLATRAPDDATHAALAKARQAATEAQRALSLRLTELDAFSMRAGDLAQRLYDEALASRMRPFGDGVAAFPRMVRDLARSLGKEVVLHVGGQATPVDRDILEKLEAPLTHLLRNAVDHGIELPAARAAAAKPAQAVIRLEAGHSAGMLVITVSDDGHGIATDPLRQEIVQRGLISAETAVLLSEAELLEFLFLPGFSMKADVSEVSGRGVGLDIVQHMVKEVRGSVRIDTRLGKGSSFRLQLPLTTSVVRAVLVDVGGEPYAFPLAQISRTLLLHGDDIEQLEGHQHFFHDGKHVGLVTAHQVLQSAAPRHSSSFPVIVLGPEARPYGVIVDRLLGECEMVVQPLDPRLGKIKDISAAALTEDGSPVLLIDVEDMMHSIDKLIAAGPLLQAHDEAISLGARKRKRVLLVDDSLTVRELERKLLLHHGYEVEVAVDGVDGWNAARVGNFDLVITDVDMPRMDGVELVTLIKQHPQLRSTPVLIVSYKDREVDRQRGLAAGADYYLTKGSFHDERLVDSVVDLIGEATE
jgi:two-component system, chemotaxis family, sensor histidine kinase and response regulator WspE